MYYDRKGNKVTIEEFAKLFEDEEYRQIERTEFSDGTIVSTVWLGINHSFSDKKLILFETMTFSETLEHLDQESWRYSTEDEAKNGHAHAVDLVSEILEEYKK